MSEGDFPTWPTWDQKSSESSLTSSWPESSHQAKNGSKYYKSAAVLLLFVPSAVKGQPARILLTRRSQHVRSHKGQISFPGGRRDHSDSSPAETALREAQEEVGIDPSCVEIKSIQPPLKSLDGSEVVPVIGFYKGSLASTDLCINTEEVDEAYFPAWTSFQRYLCHAFKFTIFGIWRDSRYFLLDPDESVLLNPEVKTRLKAEKPIKVWGLTAKILYEANLR